MLNKSGESRHPCLALGLEEGKHSEKPFSIISTASFWWRLCNKLKKFPSIPISSENFYHEYMLNFDKCFFSSMRPCDFSSLAVNLKHCIDPLSHIGPFLHCWNKPPLRGWGGPLESLGVGF